MGEIIGQQGNCSYNEIFHFFLPVHKAFWLGAFVLCGC
jgi:hypothetical protein